MTQVSEEDHRAAVRNHVRMCVASNITDLNAVLQHCEGADPVTVSEILQAELLGRDDSIASLQPIGSPISFLELPAPDPERSQWWFSTSGLAHLRDLVMQRWDLFGSKGRLLCLGTPSLAAVVVHPQKRVTARDIDPSVIQMLRKRLPEGDIEQYDAAENLPPSIEGQFCLAVLDPPWYEAAIVTFLRRAISSLAVGGEVVCTLPGRLTRPGIEQFRARLVNELASIGHEVLALERGVVQYQVPGFELAALRRLPDFRGLPWRAGDLLHFRKVKPDNLVAQQFSSTQVEVFARHPTQFRVFLRGTATADQRISARFLRNYSTNISTRAHGGEVPDVWTSEKAGVEVGDARVTRTLIRAWASGHGMQDAVRVAAEHGEERQYVEHLATALDDHLGLWRKYASATPFRSPKEIEEARSTALSSYATSSTSREFDEGSDGFRATYSRDRDRVLWSSSLRRLSDKTQLFPTAYDDDLRRRLTHSVEVLQLAATIGASFGLDRDLIEAGALAHDIGHTPFGHAGEHAIDALLNQVNEELRGFNHYEHGVDVVRFLEGPYYVAETTGFSGLNLTPEVCETVIKHTYCHGDKGGSEQILSRSKHSMFLPAGYCHLEGQAVRAADKISYLISDLEDGIRLGALQPSDLLACRFFHRPPLEFSYSPRRTLHEVFLDQRRWLLKVLMEDVILASSKRLAHLGSSSPAAVRAANEYMIQHSEEMLADVEEIWVSLQVRLLHKDRRVITANLHAARIVSTLVVACAVLPELIESRFSIEHQRLHGGLYIAHYEKLVGRQVEIPPRLLGQLPVSLLIGAKHEPGRPVRVDTRQLVMAKDYVAALTDSRAKAFYHQVIDGDSLAGG